MGKLRPQQTVANNSHRVALERSELRIFGAGVVTARDSFLRLREREDKFVLVPWKNVSEEHLHFAKSVFRLDRVTFDGDGSTQERI